jgi:pimeloyl-ACP methyl ester carboxylesterase
MTIETYSAGDISVRVWSDGGGRGLLYLHGWEQHPGDTPFLQKLAASGRHVIAPEHPGYGESTGMEDFVDIHDLALFLRGFIESLGPGPIDVIGHSLGGMFAAELAVIAPHLIRRLVLIDSFGLWQDDRPLLDPFVVSEKELNEAKWHDPSSAPDPEPMLAPSEEPNATEKILGRAKNLGAATKFMWPIPDRGLRRRARYIQMPTLILHGESDGIVPVAYAEELASLIPVAHLEVISKAGHLPMFEQEAQVVERISRFVNQE